MTESKSATVADDSHNTSETADLDFLLRAMQAKLEIFERLQTTQLMQVAKDASLQIARLQALQLHCLAGLRTRRSDAGELAAEVALTLHLTDNRAGAMISAAEALTNRLPRTFRLMDHGFVDLYRAMKVTEGTVWLSDHHARIVDTLLEDRLADKNPTQIRKATAYAAMKTDPEGAANRLAQRRSERRTVLHHQSEGTSQLSLDNAPTEKATAAYLRIDKIARTLKTTDEKRTLDQLRTDVALDLLLTGKGGAAEQAEVYLYVDLRTYLGLNDDPAEMSGHGHVPAELARHIATGPNTTLRRIITDPLTGQVIEVGKFRYRPSVDIDEFVRVRDRECRQPGCPRPAHGCLTERTPTKAGSATETDGTLSYCLRHRRLKNRADWHYKVVDDGKLVITTPTGQKVESIPPPLREPEPQVEHPEQERKGA
ncbi:DUF222 domain-containing protein [Amycolatopsis rhabdoformis]|uniref:DUF222 domain-containing protein n=1 Tax=Amycolatopsis rhabdoformis TaxID=1448059 RepID=A0ABZ1I728_9PSEU|nr:DUF222 domain-containing protein [Amycolatopsis rhabdoformis]WSE30165.1 DUF222 domain-containing protein [Amycolatopsis rhabdoformis]